jgi:3-oxoacid CoA-transferase subunit A
MDIVVPDAHEAVAGLTDGATLAVGGFGLCGIPRVLIQAVLDSGVRDLEVVSNNCGVDGAGLGLLLEARRVRRVVASYVGENKEFARQYLSGELEVELTPQGTLAERLRAGGSGIPAFFTRTGVGTVVAEGGLPWRYARDGSVDVASPPKRVERFPATAEPGGPEVDHVMETAIVADVALVRAARGDRLGNLQFHASARNFNPLVAMSGRLCVAEVEELVEPGTIDPDAVHVPGAFVHRVLALSADQARDKLVERRTTTSREGAR